MTIRLLLVVAILSLGACSVPDPLAFPLEGRPFWMDTQEGLLYASGEPLLGSGRSEEVDPERFDVIRVTINHSLQCDYGIVRIVRSGDTYTLVSKTLNGCVQKFPAPGHVTVDLVSADEWRKLIALLQEAGFWVAPTWADRIEREDAEEEECRKTGEHCVLIVRTDGSMWTVEALVGGQYRLVDDWSPESGPVFDVAQRLSKLAKVDLY